VSASTPIRSASGGDAEEVNVPVPLGRFITLEGPDGAGKTVQARLLAEALRGLGHEVVLTREPGGTALGERIRTVLLASAGEPRSALTDALLFNAARAELVERVIRPARADGAIVICDRFADSTLAYQGYGAGLPLDDLRALIAVATGGLAPDRTVLLDVPPERGLERRSAGAASERTRFEDARFHDLGFHQRVRDGFRSLAAADPDRWRVVDASGTEGEVAAAVRAAVITILPRVPVPSEPFAPRLRIQG
jgi:dTMP kinase